MNKLLLITIFLFSPLAAHAEGFIGAYGGNFSGSGISPFVYGAGFGFKGGMTGASASFVTGSKTGSSGTVSTKTEVSAATGRFDIYLGSRILSIGPQLSYISATVDASVGAISATAKVSGLLYGAGAALQIPLGSIGLGVDASYVTGTLSGASASGTMIRGFLKFWWGDSKR